MKTKTLFLSLIFIFLISTHINAMTIIFADVKGWGKVDITINSNIAGRYTIERKEENSEYIKISETVNKFYTDNSTLPEKKYFYRVKINNEISNNFEISTFKKNLIMSNMTKKPDWISKSRFSSQNFVFFVAKFIGDYSEEYTKRRKFLLEVLKTEINNSNISIDEKNKLITLMHKTINGSSLIVGKPYREKYIILDKEKKEEVTESYFLYGMKKINIKNIIQAGKMILSNISEFSVISDTSFDINKINEPGLKILFSFSQSRNNILKELINELNRIRIGRGLQRLIQTKYERTERAATSNYLFTSRISGTNHENKYIWKGNISSLNNFMNNIPVFSGNVISTLFSEPGNFLLKPGSKAGIGINLDIKAHNAELVVIIKVE